MVCYRVKTWRKACRGYHTGITRLEHRAITTARQPVEIGNQLGLQDLHEVRRGNIQITIRRVTDPHLPVIVIEAVVSGQIVSGDQSQRIGLVFLIRHSRTDNEEEDNDHQQTRTDVESGLLPRPTWDGLL